MVYLIIIRFENKLRRYILINTFHKNFGKNLLYLNLEIVEIIRKKFNIEISENILSNDKNQLIMFDILQNVKKNNFYLENKDNFRSKYSSNLQKMNTILLLSLIYLKDRE